MKFGIIPVNIGVATLAEVLEVARLAESTGIESVWTAEHVITPVKLDTRYPYTDSGEMPFGGPINFFDPLVTLSAIAAVTTSLKLGTGINILPQANPLLLAKQAASIDAFSNGRLLLGLGLGWMREEFRAMGVPFAHRGARFDDYLQAMRKVWSGQCVEHQGEFVDWYGFVSLPTPLHKERLPILIGGHTDKAMRRAARLGDGWYPAVFGATELAPLLQRFQRICAEEGRAAGSVEVTVPWDNRGGLDEVRRLRDLGVNRLTVQLPTLGDAPLDGIQKLADNIISRI